MVHIRTHKDIVQAHIGEESLPCWYSNQELPPLAIQNP